MVGAGPAGASAGYFLASQGLDVLVLEAKNLPRNKACGDGIGPRAVLLLEEMGLGGWLGSGRWHRVDRLRIISPSGLSIASSAEPSIFPIVYGYVIKRTDFDKKLVDYAKEAGAEVLEGFHADDLITENGRITGVVGRYDERIYRLTAKLTVVADGSKGALSRLFGPKLSRPQAVGLRAYALNVSGIDDCANIYFNRRFPKGYGWVFPTGTTSANIGVGLLGLNNGSDGKMVHEAYRCFIKEQDLSPVSLLGSDIEDRPVGSVMRMNFGRRPVRRPGLAFSGDAAGLVSPINGEGISHAIESSRILADCLEGKITGRLELDKALDAYEKALNRRFLSYFRWGRLLDRILSGPERLDRLIAKAQKDNYLRIILTGVLANTVHPRELARFRALTKILF